MEWGVAGTGGLGGQMMDGDAGMEAKGWLNEWYMRQFWIGDKNKKVK